jgi:hypothetical protein
MAEAIRKAVHRELVRALKPGGLVILEAFHRDQLGRGGGGPRDLSMLFDLPMLIEDVGPEVRLVHGFEGEIDLDEGRGHVCTGAVVRFRRRQSSALPGASARGAGSPLWWMCPCAAPCGWSGPCPWR